MEEESIEKYHRATPLGEYLMVTCVECLRCCSVMVVFLCFLLAESKSSRAITALS